LPPLKKLLMGGMKDFSIPFTSLKDGRHDFKFRVTSSFFEVFPNSEIEKGNIHIDVELIKNSHMLTLNLFFKGEANQLCDRCGNDYLQPLVGNKQLIVQLNSDKFEDEDDLISLPESAHALNLSQYLYEYIILFLPARKVCLGRTGESNHCDVKMIEKLNQLKSGSDSEELEKPNDPRWDFLKNLKFDK